jgi:hypothetical protein
MHFHPDIFLFAALLCLIFGIAIRIVYSRVKSKPINRRLTETIKHLGQISFGLGILLQLVELTTALDYLEHEINSFSTDKIAGGIKSTLFSTIHGLVVYLIAMTIFIILRLTEREEIH